MYKAPDLDVTEITALYFSGLFQSEIAKLKGVSLRTLCRFTKKHNIKGRDHSKRQIAEKRYNWKGKNAKYITFHARVVHKFGKPNKCEICGTDDPTKWYDWANLTGNYADIADYKRMCRSCHSIYDNKRRRVNNGRDRSRKEALI